MSGKQNEKVSIRLRIRMPSDLILNLN